MDDTVEAAEFLAEAARLNGCEHVDMVLSGEDAIGRAILADYDLITLDIRMPGVSGIEALSVIRGIRPHAIIAIVSAYVGDLQEEARRSADVILNKPVALTDFEKLLKLSREIAERRAAIRAIGKK